MDRPAAWAETIRERNGAVGLGCAFGSFGELVQGVLPGSGREFLVTLPIAAWSTAVFRYEPGAERIVVSPGGKRKSQRLTRLALDAAGRGGGGELTLSSDLPEGKGLASSSADLVATARAVAHAIGASFAETVIESLLRHIEPSDGVMYDGVVAYHHREVCLHRRLGTLPPLAIIGHDEGGQVDTIRRNQVPRRFSDADRREYGRLLDSIGEAVGAGDLREVGRVSTRSALLHTRHWPRRDLATVRRACAEIAGCGVVLAHSGTMLGILVPLADPELPAKVAHVRELSAPLGGTVTVYRSLSHEVQRYAEAQGAL